jgi:hypothetical protein
MAIKLFPFDIDNELAGEKAIAEYFSGFCCTPK